MRERGVLGRLVAVLVMTCFLVPLGPIPARATITFSGAFTTGPSGALLTDPATASVLFVGPGGGVGFIQITGGSQVNVTGPPSATTRSSVGGNSTGTVTVTDPGSRLDVNARLNVGGTGGSGVAVGVVSVLNGGKVTGTSANFGFNGGTGVLSIQGSGSEWIVAGNDEEPVFTLFQVGLAGAIPLQGHGIVSVISGGRLVVDGGATRRAAATIGGVNGASGTSTGILTVSGVGSSFEVAGAAGGALQVGRNGVGTLNIDSGGQVTVAAGSSTLVGRVEGSVGAVNVRGSGSRLDAGDLLRIGIASAAEPAGTGGSGQVIVGNGGLVEADNIRGGNAAIAVQSGGVLSTSAASLGVLASGAATLSVSGAGSAANIAGPLATGNLTNFLTVGDVGAGTVQVSAGGKVLLDGTPSGAAGAASSLGFGAGSSGTVAVAGSGSIWETRGLSDTSQTTVLSDGSTISRGVASVVGFNGTGTLNVRDGGQFVVTGTSVSTSSPEGFMNIGRKPGSVGTVSVSGTGALLNVATRIRLGLYLDSADGLEKTGGTGTLSAVGGGTIQTGEIRIGPQGTLNGGGGGTIVASTGVTILENGDATVRGGASMTAAVTVNGTLTVRGPGIVNGDVTINATGTLQGDGTINGNVVNNGGTINPGASPGTLTIAGNYQSVGGKIVLEIDQSGSHDLVQIGGTAFFDPSTQIEIKVDPAFTSTQTLTLITVQEGTTPQTALAVTVPPIGVPQVQVQGDLQNLAEPIPISFTDGSLIVGIDIRPRKFPNVVNLNKNTVPVAILSSAGFDALTVDPLSITLLGAKVKLKGDQARCKVKDVNRDKRPDLVCDVLTSSLQPGSGVAELRALAMGKPIVGRDAIQVVNGGVDDDDDDD